jgi:hypothetical protein
MVCDSTAYSHVEGLHKVKLSPNVIKDDMNMYGSEAFFSLALHVGDKCSASYPAALPSSKAYPVLIKKGIGGTPSRCGDMGLWLSIHCLCNRTIIRLHIAEW